MARPDLSSNSSFSTLLWGLQTAVDSTSLGEFKICPRRYYYSIICGYQPRQTSVHLTFGLLMHSSRERYYHARFDGASHEDAVASTVLWALKATWIKELGRGWSSGSPTKNRLTLVRSLVYYLDKYGEGDPLETLQLDNGKPAVELSFRFDIGHKAGSTGESILLCGHLDRMVRLNDEIYISDLKTTEHGLDAGYFSKFSPDNQFSLYVLAGQIAFSQPAKGLIVDALQVIGSDTRFQRGLVQRDAQQIEEFVDDTRQWLGQMESCAVQGKWPQNDKSCGLYGGCAFRSICSKSPASRQMWLDSEFKQRVWNPLDRRGDI